MEPVEPRIRELLRACPTMPATVAAERIRLPYSIRTLSTQVIQLPEAEDNSVYLLIGGLVLLDEGRYLVVAMQPEQTLSGYYRTAVGSIAAVLDAHEALRAFPR